MNKYASIYLVLIGNPNEGKQKAIEQYEKEKIKVLSKEKTSNNYSRFKEIVDKATAKDNKEKL